MTVIGGTFIDDKPVAPFTRVFDNWNPKGMRIHITNADFKSPVVIRGSLPYTPPAMFAMAWFNRNLDIIGDGSRIVLSNPDRPEPYIDYWKEPIRDKELPIPGTAGVIKRLGEMLFDRDGNGKWEYYDPTPLATQPIYMMAWTPEKHLSGEYLDIYLRSEAARAAKAATLNIRIVGGNTWSQDIQASPATNALLAALDQYSGALGIRVMMDDNGNIDDAVRVRQYMDQQGFRNVQLFMTDVGHPNRKSMATHRFAELLGNASKIAEANGIAAGAAFQIGGGSYDDLTDHIAAIKSGGDAPGSDEPGGGETDPILEWIETLPGVLRFIVKLIYGIFNAAR